MCKKIEICDKLVPVVPDKYRELEGFISCNDVICHYMDIDCCDCIIKTPVNEKDIEIIDTEDKLLEVELAKDIWACVDTTVNKATEMGGVYCNDIRCNDIDLNCENCIFAEDEFLNLNDIKYKIID